jgi:hypothetical protein
MANLLGSSLTASLIETRIAQAVEAVVLKTFLQVLAVTTIATEVGFQKYYDVPQVQDLALNSVRVIYTKNNPPADYSAGVLEKLLS